MSGPDQDAGPCALAVVGDTTVDWLVIEPVVAGSGVQWSYQWDVRTPAEVVAEVGGAALLRALLEACATGPSRPGTTVSGVNVPDLSRANPADERLTRSFTVWQPYPVAVGSAELVWRMNRFLGVTAAVAPAAEVHSAPAQGLDCLVIDDANLGFRDHPEQWPAALSVGTGPRCRIILKMANPLGSGPLWQRLVAAQPHRVTLYCAAADLRKEYAPIGQPLSWERLAVDVDRAVRGRAELAVVGRVVVSLGFSGAVIVERDGSSTLVYDPQQQEGDWERVHAGLPVGLGTCLTAALALAIAGEEPDWVRAVAAGLGAARALHSLRSLALGPGFPLAAVATALRRETGADAFVAVRITPDERWRILATVAGDDLRALARAIVVDGEREACRGLPVERIGVWSSIDRTEIESLRSVRNIIREYVLQARRTRPLSLAVFGPPGSGKSFAIKQIAREGLPGMHLDVLEFNLSQFSGPESLAAALQRVRDSNVEGALPLVFWDEFDTAVEGREFGWLARFLAPMQDGVFVDDGVPRPIGSAIFIFAGGTHSTMRRFKERAVELPGAKATDFLSRLRGYVDILGPNPSGPDDETFVLRRALLLRAQLPQKASALFQDGRLSIDPGVLRAFLEVGAYLHGARSLESIIDMSALSGRLRYERSTLPPLHQLGLHVDPQEFLSLVESGRDDR